MSALLRKIIDNERRLQEATMQRIGNIIVSTHIAEILLIMQSLTWGTWLLLPFRSITDVPGSPFFVGIQNELVWGLISIALGLTILGGIVFDKPGIKKWGLLASSSWWLFIAIFFGMRNVYSTGVPTYFSIGMTAGLSYVKHELRREREQKQRVTR